MKRRNRWLAGLAAIFLGLTVVATAAAYDGQVLGSLSIRIKAIGTCGTHPSASATLLDANGAAMPGVTVTWALVTTLSASDKVNQTSSITDANGVATTTLTLAAVSGNRTIRATAGELTETAISATAIVPHGCGGLPNTSTLPEIPATPGSPAPLALLVALGALVGAGLMVRRLAPTSR